MTPKQKLLLEDVAPIHFVKVHQPVGQYGSQIGKVYDKIIGDQLVRLHMRDLHRAELIYYRISPKRFGIVKSRQTESKILNLHQLNNLIFKTRKAALERRVTQLVEAEVHRKAEIAAAEENVKTLKQIHSAAAELVKEIGKVYDLLEE
jgi:hypothetical protein